MDVTTINGKEYEVIDTLEYITLADSFVKNKIGTGHGEAKLYIGNENEKLLGFWEDFSYPCFFLKKDFLEFLHAAQNEFEDHPLVHRSIGDVEVARRLPDEDVFGHEVEIGRDAARECRLGGGGLLFQQGADVG